jgi:dolichyl-phosphooligosaccharide-protein glycotransferase
VSRRRKLLSHEVKHQHAQHEHKHESQASGFSMVSSHYKSYKRAYLAAFTVLLILIPIVLAVWFRSPTFSLPVTRQWAQSSVEANVRDALSAQVLQQFPNLPAENRQKMVDTQFQQYMAQNQATLAPEIARRAELFKANLQDERNHTYMPDIDTYYWLLKIENIVDKGFPADARIDGSLCDEHMLAPIGSCGVKSDFYTKFSAASYELARRFSDTTPMYVFFWMPVLFGALCVIPAFFIGRKQGLLAGFFVAMVIAVHSGIIGRTGAGFADTDILVIFFPLLVAWLFLEAFEAKTWLPRLIFTTLTGLAFGLFAWSWNTWWFFFDIFLVILLGYAAYHFVKHLIMGRSWTKLHKNDDIVWPLLLIVGLVLATMLFVSVLTGFSDFLNGPIGAFTAPSDLKAALRADSIWPNTYTTVAELNEPDINGIIGSVGGKFLFMLALMGMLFALVPKDRLHWKDWALLVIGLADFLFLVSAQGTALPILWFLVVMAIPVALGGLLLLKDDRHIDVKYAFLLIVWLAASVYTMTKGVRFVLLLIPPFAIGAAITINTIYSLLKEWLVKNLEFAKAWVIPVLFIVLCLPLVTLSLQGYAAGRQGMPMMNDAWYQSLTKIKEQSAPDAIINSWWDFGHWFKEVADRGVTFDGNTQITPMAHWVGKVLLTTDEKESMAILRMLDCGSDHGVKELQARLASNDQYEAIMLTKRLIMIRHADARKLLLAKGLGDADADFVLNLTHCDPPEDYFITSGDMVGKSAVWAHFGAWDFAKADAYLHFRTMTQAEAVPAMVAKYNWTAEVAQDVYYKMQTLPSQNDVNAWISPWPGYPTGGWSGCSYTQNGTLLLCQIGINVGQQQGFTTVLEGFVLNMTQYNQSFVSVGFYDSTGNKRSANNDVRPSAVFVMQNGSTVQVNFTGQSLGYAFIVDLENNRAMMVDPLHANSLFLRLFFLDGKSTTAFEKFNDVTDFTGSRIIVWKVDWSKLKGLGLE